MNITRWSLLKAGQQDFISKPVGVVGWTARPLDMREVKGTITLKPLVIFHITQVWC